MSKKLPRALLFVISFNVAFLLYSSSVRGLPIWDDLPYWFFDPAMKPDVSYLSIWRSYGWPFSISVQKLAFGLWKNQYAFYHVFNFCLHFLNSYLVYLLGKRLRLRSPFLYFLLFLLHPACVISVAWMIQIKTLLCFTFALAALLCYLEGRRGTRWLAASWVFFFLSVTSKSASLPLPLIFLALSFRSRCFKKQALLLPFFLIAAWSGHRVLSSEVTQQGVEMAALSTTFKEIPEPGDAPVAVHVPSEAKKETLAPAPSGISQLLVFRREPTERTFFTDILPGVYRYFYHLARESQKLAASPQGSGPVETVPAPTAFVSSLQIPSFEKIKINVVLTAQTLRYYFWHSLLPTQTEPVKGLNFNQLQLQDVFHLAFLVLFVGFFWRDPLLSFLLAAHLLLLPFVGLIPAPFMNVTWVSDQHLYLVLPALIGFWLKLWERIPGRFAAVVPGVYLLLFSLGTWRAVHWYKDEFAFYETSLERNPLNAPIAYNLAYAYLKHDRWVDAYNVMEGIVLLAKHEPLLRKNVYYPHIEFLYQRMTRLMEDS